MRKFDAGRRPVRRGRREPSGPPVRSLAVLPDPGDRPVAHCRSWSSGGTSSCDDGPDGSTRRVPPVRAGGYRLAPCGWRSGEYVRPMITVDEFQQEVAAWLAENRDGAPHDYGPICPPDLIDAGLAVAAPHQRGRVRGRPLAGRARRAWVSPSSTTGSGCSNALGRVSRRSSTWSASCWRAARSSGSAHPNSRPHHLRATLATEHVWCQLFSEPGAGSDLGSLTHPGRTRRRPVHRQRPEGVVLGRPVQQLGHPHGPDPADRRRPEHGAPKHEGISFFLMPDGPARCRGPPAQADDRRGRVRRGLLHRCRPARRAPARTRSTAAGGWGWPC